MQPGYGQPGYGMQPMPGMQPGYGQAGYGKQPMPGMKPGKGMGGMGGNPYAQYNMGAYKTHNWAGYQMKGVYGFDKMTMNQHCEYLFRKHDKDMSGAISMMEFPNLIAEFYMVQGLPAPNYEDVQYLMYKFDIDHDGQISYHEFTMMLKNAGGHKQYSHEMIKDKKGKGKKGKKDKKGKHGKGGQGMYW